MNSKIEYKVNGKENLYFWLRLISSLGLYALFAWLLYYSFTDNDPRS